MSNQNIKISVMRRIRFIYYVRQIFQPLVIEATALAFFVGLVGALVSVEQVFRNMLNASDVSELVAFVWSAVTHTELAVQVLLFGTALFFVGVARQFYRETRLGKLVPITIRQS